MKTNFGSTFYFENQFDQTINMSNAYDEHRQFHHDSKHTVR